MPLPLNVIWQRDLTLSRYWVSVDSEANFTPIMPREYGWICDLLRGFDVCHHLDGRFEITAENPIVVLEGQQYDPREVRTYLERLRALGQRVGIIHIGDEFGVAPLEVYDQAAFVYRNYWRPEISEIEHCHYLPLGVNCSLEFFERPPSLSVPISGRLPDKSSPPGGRCSTPCRGEPMATSW